MPKPPCKRPFKFEHGWLKRDDFSDLVKLVWEKHVAGLNTIQRWNKEIIRYAYIPWWMGVTYIWVAKDEKLRLSSLTDDIEVTAYVRLLTMQEIEMKCCSNTWLAELLPKSNSSGTNNLKLNSFWKEIRI
jgi:hypothetical protein